MLATPFFSITTEPRHCTNPYCCYGRDFDEGGRTTRRYDGTVPERDRAASYDQDPDRWGRNQPAYGGLCLNCLDDQRQALECWVA